MNCLGKHLFKRTLIHCSWEHKTILWLWKIFRELLIKSSIYLQYDTVNLLIGVYPREMKVYVHTKTFDKCSRQLLTSQKLKTIQISVNKWWINKSCTSTLCNTTQQQKEWNIDMCLDTYTTRINLKIIILSKSQTQKNTHYIIPFIYNAN